MYFNRLSPSNGKNMLSYFISVLFVLLYIGCGSSSVTQTTTDVPKEKTTSWLNLDTVKAGPFDTGRMWTFDFPPKDYFKTEYNFVPTEEWYNKVRMSALRFANYCSASFVSGDGLVMTNHHCGRESVTEVTKEGEDLHKEGFIAVNFEDERPVPGLYVDQLVLIRDVTSEIQEAIDKGTTEADKLSNKQKAIKDLQLKTKEETQLECSVVTFFNGGKYSLYGYKRYTDVRLVFAPETNAGFFGGDPDNFTYPRYTLDCTFFRVYDEEGKPLKTENYFKWSPNGAAPGEAVFVVGNPGRTNRLNTVAQLEYQRDYTYPVTMNMLNSLVDIYTEMLNEFPDRAYELQDQVFGYANSQKAYNGILDGLRNPILMQKKRDFEKNFKEAVMKRPDLKAKYGDLWDKIAGTRSELSKFTLENAAYSLNPIFSTKYLMIANKVVDIARNLQLPVDQQKPDYAGEELEKTIDKLYADLDVTLQEKLYAANVKAVNMLLGENNPIAKKLSGGYTGKSAINYINKNSVIVSKERTLQLVKKGADAILSSDDPFLFFILATQDKAKNFTQTAKEITTRESDYVQQLGRAVFEVYGTSIPPDATFTLRLADGVVQGYKYNGTIAPPVTTFYGMYDRYYSFGKEFPFELHNRWLNPSPEFQLETPFNFVSTNDIIGGNSGSPLINKNAEVVGLAFDGNMESLPGQFIFDMEANRTVSLHSAGMLEAIQDLYKLKRISEELKNGKIVK
ncbi:MAG: S46 family peptidase [Ignavibacteriaceae bacterium]